MIATARVLAVGVAMLSAAAGRFATAADPPAVSRTELLKHVVRIHAETKPAGVSKEFSAIVMEYSDGTSYLMSTDWGAQPFELSANSTLETATMELASSKEPVTVIAFDETFGVSVLSVKSKLEPLPATLIGDELRVDDILQELKLPELKDSGPHRVMFTGQDFHPYQVDGEKVVIKDTIVFSGRMANNPGSLLLKEGRVAALFLNNESSGGGRLHSYALPIAQAEAAYSELRSSPRKVWKQQSKETPETDSSPKQAIPARAGSR